MIPSFIITTGFLYLICLDIKFCRQHPIMCSTSLVKDFFFIVIANWIHVCLSIDERTWDERKWRTKHQKSLFCVNIITTGKWFWETTNIWTHITKCFVCHFQIRNIRMIRFQTIDSMVKDFLDNFNHMYTSKSISQFYFLYTTRSIICYKNLSSHIKYSNNF